MLTLFTFDIFGTFIKLFILKVKFAFDDFSEVFDLSLGLISLDLLISSYSSMSLISNFSALEGF